MTAKRALITGASRGIGAACAAALARDGMRTFINYSSDAENAAETANLTGGTALRFDVSDHIAAGAAFSDIGGVDVLVANAGVPLFKLLTDTTPDEWRRVFAVNSDGVYNVCRLAIPGMVHEKWGRIIIISSMWGIRGASCEAAYSASKASLIGLTKALAKELGPSGITVNCIAPGVIDTDMNKNLSPETLDALVYDTPLGRLGTPEDVAELAAFLASDRAGFITGQVISVDGGFAV